MSDEVVKRLEAVAARLEAVASRMGAGGGDDDEVPFWVTDFENIVKNEVAACVAATEALKIPEMGPLLKQAYDNSLALIQRAPNTKKPSSSELMAFLQPGVDAIGQADNLRYKGKAVKTFGDHFKAMYEAILVVSWVTMAPPMGLPAQHVDGQMQSCEFNLMRVQRNDKSAEAKAWVKTTRALNKKMVEYVKSNFKKTGLLWNPKGQPLGQAAPASGGGNSNSNSNQEEQKQQAPAKKSSKPKSGMNDVFAQLRKGTDITKGMKKVTANMKTKNRSKADRSGKVVMKAKTSKKRKKFGPPGIVFQGGRWIVENYDDTMVEVDKPTLKQNLFITTNDNSTINVTAQKVKAITIDNCVKTRVYIRDVVSTVEIVNCRSVSLMVQGKAPSVAVDKSESVNVILFDAAYQNPPQFVTSNITAMNITIPGKNAGDDEIEIPVPEQFLVSIDKQSGTLVTRPTEH